MTDSSDAALPLQPGQLGKASTKLDDNEHPNDHMPNSLQSQEILDFSLKFLSTSSNETLLCVFACLMVATYIILGRVGLILIGTVLGVVLHASWDAASNESTVNEPGHRKSNRKRELALEVANRLLDRRKQQSTAVAVEDRLKATMEPDYEYSSFRPETASALRSLTDAVIKDYVNFWYEPILPSESSFPHSCRGILTNFITSASSHLARKRTADTFLEFLMNSSSITIVFLNELSTALQATGSVTTPEENIMRYLESFPESSLSNVLADQQQRKKLNMAADDILSSFLEKNAYGCSAIRDFLREILAGVILPSVISSLSRPEFINGWIIHIFSEGESEIMSAIDAGVEGARNQGVGIAKASSNMGSTIAAPAGTTEADLQSSGITEQQSLDKATEDAIMETKRLSVLIAAQDAERQDGDQTADNRPQGPFMHTKRNDETTANIGLTQNSMEKDTHITKPTINGEMENTNEPVSHDGLRSTNPTRSPSPSVSLSSGSKEVKSSSESTRESPFLTLHGASVSVDDGSEPGHKGPIKSKPTSNYLLQVEPVSSRSTGWMVFRKYADFEMLHGTLETISRLNNLRDFPDQHYGLPPWKGETKQGLARNLERYLHDALQCEPLAESERMKRFLEKDGPIGLEPAGSPMRSGFSFPSQNAFENMGKGVLDALSNAPKGVAGGGKAVLDGMTGVFGAVGSNSKRFSSSVTSDRHLKDPPSSNEPFQVGSSEAESPMSRPTSTEFASDTNDNLPSYISNSRQSSSSFGSHSNRTSLKPLSPARNDSLGGAVGISEQTTGRESSGFNSDTGGPLAGSPPSSDIRVPENTGLDSPSNATNGQLTEHHAVSEPNASRSQSSPITHDETQMAVELIFAVINELYTLSSAWNIRRTLLNAAKSYILRPGSPTLETIRSLLQDSMIEAHTSDEAIGMYLTKIRENALPTQEELNSWPASPSDAEKQRLKDNARKLLVQRGLPQALTSVMGAAASREALEKIFDCLQVENVARGLVFSILLQGLRAVTL